MNRRPTICPRPLAASRAWFVHAALLVAALLVGPGIVSAQTSAPVAPLAVKDAPQPAENYHIEFSGSFWNAAIRGNVASNQPNIIGTSIDFVSDLGFQAARFKDASLILRPTKKNKFRFEYTPLTFTATSNLQRNIVFHGLTYNVSIPVLSQLNWKVMRFGYEYDVISRPRGFAGMFVEGRYTQLTASLTSLVASGSVLAQVPLPALGFVGRAYVVKNVSATVEVGGFKIPTISNKYQGNYYDVDIYGTVNLCRYAGAQVGWRRMTTFIDVQQADSYTGNFTFQGLWFGGVVRY